MNNSRQIRILHVVTYMGRGGLETMIMNYYRHIDRDKVQFDFLVHRDFRADYDDEIESLGGRIFRVPRLVPWSRNYIKALEGFFLSHPEYKIVHVHQDCLSSVILKVAKKCGVLVRIAHSHNSNQDKNLKYPIKLFYKRSIPTYATHLFACGKDAGDWMFGGADYRVINNAIDSGSYSFDHEKRVQVRKSLGISDGTFVIAHVGRFNTQKNHTFLLDIFAETSKRNDKAILLLVGDGILKPEMENKAATLGLVDKVIFTGVRSDIQELMQAMDCFVFPSLYEGLGIVAIEAQAAGLPCVVSDKVPPECDITNLIKHIPLAKSAAAWAEEISKTQSVIRQNTRLQIVEAGFDIQANAQWLQNFYLEQ